MDQFLWCYCKAGCLRRAITGTPSHAYALSRKRRVVNLSIFFSWLRICYCENKYYTRVLLLSYFIKNRIWKAYIAKIIAVSYFGARFDKVLNMPWVLNMSRLYIYFWICVWLFSECQSFCAIAWYGLAGLSKILR